MDESYRDIEFELYGNLVQIKNILSYYETQDEILTGIDKGIAQIKSKMYNVAVMGEFRRGKSSLINALLGLDVLPSDVTPTTATINRITFGTEPKVTIHFKDGRRQEISISELQSYVTKITEENEKTALTIREAVICYPTVICQNHVDIIDTPGLNDDEDMTRTTIGMLKSIDAVIIAVSALSPYSETEKNFVAQLIGTGGISNIVFVVTFIDQVDEEDLPKLLGGIRARIAEMTAAELKARFPGRPDILEKGARLLNGDSMRIFGVSAKQALKSFGTGDRRLLQKSRFVEFKEDLYKILTAQQSINIVEKTSALINSAAERFDTIYRDKFDVISAEISRLKTGLEQVRGYYGGGKALFDAVRGEYGDRLAALVSGPASAYGEVIGFFVAELTKVKINDANLIQKAIETGGVSAERFLHDQLRQASEAANRIFLSLGKRISERRESSLLRHILPGKGASGTVASGAVITPLDAGHFISGFKERIRALQPPSYAASPGLVPQHDNLAHCNVIAHIRQAVTQDLAACRNGLSSYVEACWSVCHTYISFDDGLKDALLDSLSGALDKAETAMLVCRSNYQLHKVMVENLVRGTNELLERFEQRG